MRPLLHTFMKSNICWELIFPWADILLVHQVQLYTHIFLLLLFLQILSMDTNSKIGKIRIFCWSIHLMQTPQLYLQIHLWTQTLPLCLNPKIITFLLSSQWVVQFPWIRLPGRGYISKHTTFWPPLKQAINF